MHVHSSLQSMGGSLDGEALHIQQQLAALYAAADKAGAAGLTEEALGRIPTCVCDKPMLAAMPERHTTCAAEPHAHRAPIPARSVHRAPLKPRHAARVCCRCAICHEDFGVGESLRVLPCGHKYHANCVGHWLRIKAACPMCNQKVRP